MQLYKQSHPGVSGHIIANMYRWITEYIYYIKRSSYKL